MSIPAGTFPGKLLAKLHVRLGDFWWYSLMIFLTCRFGDALNVFVGLWLVPKYVDPSELGAVMPLTQFASCLSMPVAIFVLVFTKEVNTLAAHREYGKMKTLLSSVFIATGVILALAILVSRLLMPFFLERMRVAGGSLALVIVAASFVGAASPVYTNALQALKRFRTISILNILCAPIRLLTMLVAMQFRPLSGYFVGQAATPTFGILASLYALRHELAVKAEAYWTKPVVRHTLLFCLAIAAYQVPSAIGGLVEQTVLRQRLPELDSAAYYMVTRFSDIASFISATLLLTLFPYTAELADAGRDTRPLVLKSSAAMLALSIPLAVFFALFGRPLLRLLPHGDTYGDYAWAIPWMIGIVALQSVQGFHINTEVSARRFGFLKWWIPIHLLYPAILLLVTGHGYLRGFIPSSWTDFLTVHNVTSLSSILIWFTAITLLRLAFCIRDLLRQRN